MTYRLRIIATALVALSVLMAGVAYLVARVPAYRSEAKLALIPPADADVARQLLRSFERSDAPGTYVQLIASSATVRRAGSPPVDVSARAVPGTRVIEVATYGDAILVRPGLEAIVAAAQSLQAVRGDLWQLAPIEQPSTPTLASPGDGRVLLASAVLAALGAWLAFVLIGRLVPAPAPPPSLPPPAHDELASGPWPSGEPDNEGSLAAPPVSIGILQRATNQSSAVLVVTGLALAAGTISLAALRVLGADEGRFPIFVAAAAVAAILAAQPRWIVPGFIALTWGSIGTAAAAGVPTPVLLLLPVALWQGFHRPRVTRRVLLVLSLLSLPLLAASLLAADGPVFDPKNLKEMVFLFVVAMVVTGVRTVHSTAVALALIGLLLGAGGVYSVLAHPIPLFPLSDEPGGLRAAGPFGEPNFFALSLAALLPMAMYVVALGGRMQILGTAAGLSIVAGVFATGSRGGLLAAGAAIVVFAAMTRLPRLRVAALLTVVAALALIPTFGAQTAAFGDRSVEGRATENLVAVAMFADHPLVGVGPGQYRELYRDYTRVVGDDDRYRRFAHSLPLELAAEQGIAGIAGWIAAGTAVLAYAFQRGVWRLLLGRALILSMATYLLGSLFLHGAQIRLLFILAALVLALAASLPRPRGEPH